MSREVAVVLLNFNGRAFLEQFLPSVTSFSGEAKVYVADNGSTDDSVEFVRQNFDAVGIIQLEKNLGFAGGYNKALKSVGTKYLALVNTDVEVTSGWLDSLVDFLDQNAKYAAVQPKILDQRNRDHFEYAGAAGGFIDLLGYPYCRGRIFNELEKDNGQYDGLLDVDWTTGACMVIRKDAFDSVGGFDEDFFAHMEEIDLCWRLRAEGLQFACVPESRVYHVGGGTLSKSSPTKTFLNFRNGLVMLQKNLPTRSLLWKIPTRLVLDGLAALKLGVSESPSHVLAVMRAHFSFYKSYFKNRSKRGQTLDLSRRSILISHFLKGKKKYSDLDQ